MLRTYYENINIFENNNSGSCTELTGSELMNSVLGNMSDYYKSKYERMKPDKSKKEELLTAYLLDKALAEFNYREKDMIYKEGEYGKPYFENAPEIFFSVSHSDGEVLVALCDKEIGCDIEKRNDDIDKIIAISKRCYHPIENEYVEYALQGDDEASDEEADELKKKHAIETFYDIWSMKEAFVKASGLGMSKDFKTFNVLSPGILKDENGIKVHNFISFDEIDGYSGAIFR